MTNYQRCPEWGSFFYGSGTTIVKNIFKRGEPWYYLYGPRDENEDAQQSHRYKMCQELANWLNGGERPPWIGDLKRSEEGSCFDLDGTLIYACGPYLNCDPPQQDDSDEARSMRARLIDRLFGIFPPTTGRNMEGE